MTQSARPLSRHTHAAMHQQNLLATAQEWVDVLGRAKLTTMQTVGLSDTPPSAVIYRLDPKTEAFFGANPSYHPAYYLLQAALLEYNPNACIFEEDGALRLLLPQGQEQFPTHSTALHLEEIAEQLRTACASDHGASTLTRAQMPNHLSVEPFLFACAEHYKTTIDEETILYTAPTHLLGGYGHDGPLGSGEFAAMVKAAYPTQLTPLRNQHFVSATVPRELAQTLAFELSPAPQRSMRLH